MKDKLIGVFLALMGLIALGGGAVELKDSLATKAPTSLTWQQFAARKAQSGWFKISGAQLDVTGALWVESRATGEMGNVYVPAHDANQEFDDKSPIEMLVKVDDAKIVATVKELKELNKGTDEVVAKAATKYALSHAKELVVERPLVGTLAEGFDAVDSDDESAIRGAGAALASNFVILQENAKPEIGGRLFMVLGGLGITLLGLFYIFLKKPAPPAPATPSGLPPLSK